MSAVPAKFRDLGALVTAEDDALTGFGLRLAPPTVDVHVTVSAKAAYEVAMQHAPPEKPTAPPSVVLASGIREWGWPDGGPVTRLIYLVRWDDVHWLPTGGPAPGPGEPRRRPQAVSGTQTTLVDAVTGAFLGLHRSGAPLPGEQSS